MLIAVLLCIDGAHVIPGGVARIKRIKQTRAEIAIEGPKIVTQMLTYDPKSLHRRFRPCPVAGHRQVPARVGR